MKNDKEYHRMWRNKNRGKVREAYAKYYLNNPEEIKKAFMPENHQWLTIQESLKKGDNYNG